jgi:hypothetical protein
VKDSSGTCDYVFMPQAETNQETPVNSSRPMKPAIRLIVLTLALGALCLPTLASDAGHAQPTWRTLADFQCAPPATVDALAKDAAGHLYAAISTADEQGRMRAQIRKSSDGGATWSLVEEFASSFLGSVQFLSLDTDTTGHVYAAGYLADDQGQYRWIVRKSDVGGTTWSTVDDFALPGIQRTIAQALTVYADGRISVAGYGDAPSDAGQPHPRTRWLVRQSRDGGRTWTTLDDFNHQHSAKATAILSTPNGLFVAGTGWNGNTNTGEHWLVRQGVVDGTGTFQWQTVDEFRLQDLGRAFGSQAHGLGLDEQGHLYVVGRGYASGDGGNSVHWVVRRASRAGTDWALVDTFQLRAGDFAAAIGVASDNPSGVYVVGRATDRRSGSHWIVRHSPTGEAGSWKVSDDFSGTTAMAILLGVGLTSRTPDGSMRSPAAAYATGLAIVSDSTGVYTGGSIRMETSHALVRKLQLVNPTKLATTAAQ